MWKSAGQITDIALAQSGWSTTELHLIDMSETFLLQDLRCFEMLKCAECFEFTKVTYSNWKSVKTGKTGICSHFTFKNKSDWF